MSPVVEEALFRASGRARRNRFLRLVARLALAVSGLYLLLGLAILSGLVVSRGTATALSSLLAGGAILAFVLLAILTASPMLDRADLARAVEERGPQLQDRLNTLVYLETRPYNDPRRRFLSAIAAQARRVLETEPPERAPLPRPTRHELLGAVALALAAFLLFRHYGVWGLLKTAPRSAAASTAAAVSGTSPLPPPDANALETTASWGEVRITDPGRDLTVTKVDAVPLQIEAGASQPLEKVEWWSAVNGGAEVPHPLELGKSLRYAVFEPVVYVDELRLTDWDVLTYYARARTERGLSFASDLYVLEVRPFREDILKLPGGETGKAARLLDELGALIERQGGVLRETHRNEQMPEGDARRDDLRRLSAGEAELEIAAGHLYGAIASEMENQPVGDILDHLAQAEGRLGKAARALDVGELEKAKEEERAALKELVSTRKNLQKLITEHPEAFRPRRDESRADAEPADKLREIAEYRDEARTASEELKAALRSQRDVEKRAEKASGGDRSKLAAEEKALSRRVKEVAEAHPRAFRDLGPETKDASDALERAAEALEKLETENPATPAEATKRLEKLAEGLDRKSMAKGLANAYRLERLLGEKRQRFEELAERPDAPDGDAVRASVGQAERILDELERAATEAPTRDAFGPPLREALQGKRREDVDAALRRLAGSEGIRPGGPGDSASGAAGDARRQVAARRAAEALGDVSKAFRESAPPVLREVPRAGSLQQARESALERGLAQLRSLLREAQEGRLPAKADELAQRREAMENLRNALAGPHGNDSRSKELLLLIERALDEKASVLDVKLLEKLSRELELVSAEVKDPARRKAEDAAITHLDPSKLPPAYRGRIQTYFKRLSERER